VTAGELEILTASLTGYGGLMVNSVLAGERTVEPIGGMSRSGIALSDVFAGADGKYSRIISGGFEVANTTSELYKQGAVTTYCAPTFPQRVEYVAFDSGTGIVSRTGSANHFAMPPCTVQQAQLYSGSRVWEAAEGCYVPFRFHSMDVPPTTYQSVPFILDNVTPGTALTWDNMCSADLVTPVVPGTTSGLVSNVSIGPVKYNTMHNQGAYFTGLSEQTSLTVVLHLDLEVFPSSDSTLISLATPSASYDPVALDLAAKTQTMLPVAVMRRDNDAGDWFRKIMKVVSTVSGYASYVPGGIGTAAGLVHGASEAAIHASKMDKQGRKKAAKEAVNAASKAVRSIPALQAKKK
jgi:hypothetical protein